LALATGQNKSGLSIGQLDVGIKNILKCVKWAHGSCEWAKGTWHNT